MRNNKSSSSSSNNNNNNSNSNSNKYNRSKSSYNDNSSISSNTIGKGGNKNINKCLMTTIAILTLPTIWTRLDMSPVTRSLFSFSCNRSRASWRPTARMSFFCRAVVMYLKHIKGILRRYIVISRKIFIFDLFYMCMSRNLSMAPPFSACSISSSDSSWTNHSKER